MASIALVRRLRRLRPDVIIVMGGKCEGTMGIELIANARDRFALSGHGLISFPTVVKSCQDRRLPLHRRCVQPAQQPIVAPGQRPPAKHKARTFPRGDRRRREAGKDDIDTELSSTTLRLRVVDRSCRVRTSNPTFCSGNLRGRRAPTVLFLRTERRQYGVSKMKPARAVALIEGLAAPRPPQRVI